MLQKAFKSVLGAQGAADVAELCEPLQRLWCELLREVVGRERRRRAREREIK
jgi:hypothetical protein